LLLLPRGRLGRRLASVDDDAATVLMDLGLFLLPCGRPRPRFSTIVTLPRLVAPTSVMADNKFG
jgi:hypothetical protein